jgi:hypothetical protein
VGLGNRKPESKLRGHSRGKLDLFGAVDDCVPCVIELKVKGSGRSRGDTPLRALLEAFAYCAVVEANAGDIRSEAAEQHGLELTEARPALVVMAPADYWVGYLQHRKAGEWVSAIRDLVAGMAETMQLEVHLLALLDAGFEMGFEGKRARLTGDCRVVSIDGIEADTGHPHPQRARRQGRKRVTTDDVKRAIADRLGSIVGPDALRQDFPHYTRALTQNFVAEDLGEDVRADFFAGDGGELEGDPPKMCAAHSSSAPPGVRIVVAWSGRGFVVRSSRRRA